MDDNPRLRRRTLLTGAGITGTSIAIGSIVARVTRDSAIGLPRAVAGLPEGQHRWNDALSRDADGNPVSPKFHRLLLFDVPDEPTGRSVRRLEAALRALEHRFPWRHDGLLHAIGWSRRYFSGHTAADPPIPAARALAVNENPELDGFDACLHLACDDAERLDAVERALVRGAGPLSKAEEFALDGVLQHRATRTGFVGEGLPAAHQSLSGIPQDRPVREEAPLFMGFKSGFRRNQATEEDVTIGGGPLGGGTTMHVSHLRLRLQSWYELLDDDQRAARMFSPQVSADDIDTFGSEAPPHSDKLTDTAAEHGVVGHLQATAAARRGGRPIILRRDFNTSDHGEAGLHFVALQREVADFEATRTAMNASNMTYVNSAITTEVNNGIKEFLFVTARANYVVPPRSQRSFPLLPGRDDALQQDAA